VLQFITYLAGETNENPGFLEFAPGGSWWWLEPPIPLIFR
jgi:hypothetical protein